VSGTTILILVFANVILLAFALLAVRRSMVGLKAELKRNMSLSVQSSRYRELFEETDMGAFKSDVEGILKYVNQAGVKILGFDRAQELYDKNITAFQFYADIQDDDRIRSMLQQGLSIQNQYFEIKNVKGETLYIEANAREIRDGRGNLIGFDGFFRDVTQRVTTQNALRFYSDNLENLVREKTREMLELERKKFELEKRAAVGEMTSAFVHELRNPLSSMKMAFLTIKKQFEFDEPINRIMEVAFNTGQKMERILRDVLDFTRPQELRLIRQDLRPILNLAADSVENESKRPGIALRREFTSDILTALFDSTRLGQAVRNLLQNAFDALPDGHGEITLKTEFLQDEEVLRITVSDNGAGIAGEDQGRVFEPFFTRKDGGTGLGLTLVQKIAEAHRGRAAVESKPGQGTTAYIELPADRP
jgi:PAS domain S-box-containing protein